MNVKNIRMTLPGILKTNGDNTEYFKKKIMKGK